MNAKSIKSVSASSRVRAPNFTKEEQLLLITAIEPYSYIIECKKTDSTKQIDKQNAWSKVAEVYNANTKGVIRPVENLISCYRNTKSKVKKQHSEAKMLLEDPNKKEALLSALEDTGKNWDSISSMLNTPVEVCQESFVELQKASSKADNNLKRQVMGTGGGPPPADEDPLKKIKKFIDPQIDGLYTIYDGDASLMEQFEKTKPIEEQSQPIEKSFIEYDFISPTPSTSNTSHIGDNTPKRSPKKFQQLSRIDILKKRRAPELEPDNEGSSKKKKNINESFLCLSKEKLELVRLQKQMLEMELAHKDKIMNLELEDKLDENKFNKARRQKELLLLDLKIKKESH